MGYTTIPVKQSNDYIDYAPHTLIGEKVALDGKIYIIEDIDSNEEAYIGEYRILRLLMIPEEEFKFKQNSKRELYMPTPLKEGKTKGNRKIYPENYGGKKAPPPPKSQNEFGGSVWTLNILKELKSDNKNNWREEDLVPSFSIDEYFDEVESNRIIKFIKNIFKW